MTERRLCWASCRSFPSLALHLNFIAFGLCSHMLDGFIEGTRIRENMHMLDRPALTHGVPPDRHRGAFTQRSGQQIIGCRAEVATALRRQSKANP